MADEFQNQLNNSKSFNALGFEERLGFLVDAYSAIQRPFCSAKAAVGWRYMHLYCKWLFLQKGVLYCGFFLHKSGDTKNIKNIKKRVIGRFMK